jgi:glycosyltransferase involved in cell wall biosynthesis
MKSVAFFSNQFADAKGHGLARYARELHSALSALGHFAITPVAGWTSLPPAEFAVLQQTTGLRLTGLGRRLTPLAWNYLGRPTLERLLGRDVDVVHAVALGYPVATRKPLVVTIHDLGPLTCPQYFTNTRPWVMRRSLEQAERRADAIICVSRATADEVVAVAGPTIADRIRVVPEGVSEAFFAKADPACLAGLDLPPDGVPNILSAGKISPRKNIEGVLAAFARVRDIVPHHVVLVGGDGWDMDAVNRHIGSPGLRARVHLLGYVSDDQLRALYQRAALYVHPSLYEGFGLTVLEAMASGVPVISSNTSALPEVVGEAGRLVDPTDTDALAEAMAELCLDRALACELAHRGRLQAARFRWSDCAAAVAGIYSELGS